MVFCLFMAQGNLLRGRHPQFCLCLWRGADDFLVQMLCLDLSQFVLMKLFLLIRRSCPQSASRRRMLMTPPQLRMMVLLVVEETNMPSPLFRLQCPFLEARIQAFLLQPFLLVGAVKERPQRRLAISHPHFSASLLMARRSLLGRRSPHTRLRLCLCRRAGKAQALALLALHRRPTPLTRCLLRVMY